MLSTALRKQEFSVKLAQTDFEELLYLNCTATFEIYYNGFRGVIIRQYIFTPY